jgi:hypothetical protein
MCKDDANLNAEHSTSSTYEQDVLATVAY